MPYVATQWVIFFPCTLYFWLVSLLAACFSAVRHFRVLLGGMRPADSAPKAVLPPPAPFCCCFQVSSAANWGPAPVFMLASIPCSAGSVIDVLGPAAVQRGSGNRLVLQSLLILYQCFPLQLQNVHVYLKGTRKHSPPANPVNLTKTEFQSTSFVSFSPLLS